MRKSARVSLEKTSPRIAIEFNQQYSSLCITMSRPDGRLMFVPRATNIYQIRRDFSRATGVSPIESRGKTYPLDLPTRESP